MALYTVKGSDKIPENAIKVDRSEALTYQKELVRDWKNATDVIFLRNAKFLASGIIGASSFVIMKHLRKMYNLGNHFTFFTYYPVLIITPFLNMWNFDSKVTNNVLLMEMKCPICWQVRYCLQQTLSGVIFPFAFGNILCSYSAMMKQTFEVPDFSKEPKKFFQLIYKFYKNGAMKLKILAVFHILSSFFWPYIQNVELNKITYSLQEKSKSYNNLML